MPTEKACRDYLIQQRWDGHIVCPYCGYSDKVYIIEGGKRFKCGADQKVCGKKFSVTVGTIFESSRIPLTKWLSAVYVVTAHKKGISSHQLGRDLGVTQRTAWFMIHRIREMMKNVNNAQLQGEIEMDETYIGGKRKNKHKSVRLGSKHTTGQTGKAPVFGMLQRQGNIFIQAFDHQLNGDTLKPIIREKASKDAVLITDSFGGYKDLHLEFSQHEIISHGANEFVRGRFHTNSIEGFFSQFKRGVYGIYHQVSVRHLQRYCDEFAYRYNTRKIKDAERFTLSLQNMERRLTWDRLTKKQ
jgi:transposase-like protein